MPFLEEIAEDLRAANAAAYTGRLGEDSRFWQDFGFAFKLHGDPRAGGQAVEFPLVLSPKSYTKRLDAAKELTKVQGGGVVKEEQGVITGEIRLRGDFGFFPKSVRGVPVPLSGQAHFMRLQEQCFERYWDLVSDPTVSENVFLTFHSLGTNEHFIVVPDSFGEDRDASHSRFTHGFDIPLTIIGDAAKLIPKAIEDDNVLALLADSRRAFTKGLATLLGAAADSAGINPRVMEEIQAVQRAGDGVLETAQLLTEQINGVQVVAGHVSNFLRGVKRVVAIPLETVKDLIASTDAIAATVARAENLPADVVQIYREMGDALTQFAAYPEKFRSDYDEAAARYLALVAGPAKDGVADLEAAEASSVTQPQQLDSTALRPGDRGRVDGGVYGNRVFPRYRGFIEHIVVAGDTLPRLAAHYLGDARRWIDIAIANDLKAPYISDDGIPSTVAVGGRVLIPTLQADPEIQTVRASGEREIGASQYEALLGRGLMLEQDANGYFDLAVDVAGGSEDFKSVAGVELMKQTVLVILYTERGTNVLYMRLGLRRLVGEKATFDRLIEARLNIAESIQRDSRVERVERVEVVAEGDVVYVSVLVLLVGNIKARVIARAIP
jgi:hypothetical protein